jgi:chromosome partitioning protein
VIVAIHNHKGGVGKSTTAIHLGAALAMSGQTVAVIDADAQADTTKGLGVEPRAGTARWFQTGEWTAEPARERLDLLPTIALRDDEPVWWEQIPPATVAERFSAIRDQYGWIIVDTPPTVSTWIRALLGAADRVLVPVDLEFYSFDGVQNFIRGLPAGKLVGLLPMRFDRRTSVSPRYMELLKRIGGAYVIPAIRECVDLRKAAEAGSTIWEFAPASTAAEDYLTTLEWMVDNFGRI